ncbi:ribosomal RNA small subunit methyltransferase H [Clostridia bacterium]|nr:ribosomal RNA small subunit methyltransferase H [Clostridia bacterium]
MEFKHESVLLRESIEALRIKPTGIYLDGTVGGGGHAKAILSKLNPQGKLIALDQDEDAIKAAKKNLVDFLPQTIFVRENYQYFLQVLDDLQIPLLDGILLDLGVSSYQIDQEERGFTYRKDAPLDMRMDQRSELTAEDLVNTLSMEKLSTIFREYGEEPFARNIAKHIVRYRENKPFHRTTELAAVIEQAIPKAKQKGRGHPAKRVFQALRIALNQELTVLEAALPLMVDHLNIGGRLCVITFHSLEDRIVKKHFQNQENPCICPPDFPVCQCNRKAKGKIISKKPICPSGEELKKNKRAKSAKLRILQRI